VAARLAAGHPPRRPPSPAPGSAPAAEDAPRTASELLTAGVRAAVGLGWAASAPVASAAMTFGAPGGALVRSAVLARAPAGGERLEALHAEMDALGARFDGRLRIACVDRATGHRVVFGAPGAPPATVADAVVASCSIPWRFAPVTIEGREYVDGGVWSATNLDAAPGGRGTQVLCVDPIAGLPAGAGRGLDALRGAFTVAAQIELQGLRARGAQVRHVRPDAAATAAFGPDLMDERPAAEALAHGYAQGLALGTRG
jgi:NTE family protein